MLGWLVGRDINPHIPVLDKASRIDGTWSRTDFEWDPENNQLKVSRSNSFAATAQNLRKMAKLYMNGRKMSTA